MAKVKIIYGTTGGNTKLVCEKVTQVLQEAGLLVDLQQVDIADPEKLTEGDVLILASPTYGHGLLDEHFIPFFKVIQGKDLGGMKCAVIGLGDDKYDYDYHIESAGILSKYVTTHNGQLLLPPLMISKTPIPHLNTVVRDWAKELASLLSESSGIAFDAAMPGES